MLRFSYLKIYLCLEFYMEMGKGKVKEIYKIRKKIILVFGWRISVSVMKIWK